MTVQNVLALLGSIVDRMEELSIERDSLMEILHKAGFSAQDIRQVWADAKSDPEMRSRARQAFDETRRLLTEEGVDSLIGLLAEEPPKGGPVN